MSSFLLVGCNMNNDKVPSNNETPMQEVHEGVDRVVPNPGVNTESPVNNNGLNTKRSFSPITTNYTPPLNKTCHFLVFSVCVCVCVCVCFF
jgi:hypothetical protein